MSGWDRDESGDYTPPNPPVWVWYGVGLVFVFPLLVLVLIGVSNS